MWLLNEKYTDYWINAVEKSIDGTIIPSLAHARKFLSEIPNMGSNPTILDIGCSFGRMFDALHEQSENIHGLDVENSALKKAGKFSYKTLKNASAEQSGFENEFADLIFTWLVFDVLDQEKFVKEAFRVLKQKGVLFFTGTSNNYLDDDDLAFNAEKKQLFERFS